VDIVSRRLSSGQIEGSRCLLRLSYTGGIGDGVGGVRGGVVSSVLSGGVYRSFPSLSHWTVPVLMVLLVLMAL
jgi:hypothetical protein